MHNKTNPLRISIPGPLAVYRTGLMEDLAEKGYTERSTTHVVYLLAHIDQWLSRQGLRPEQFTDEEIARFLRERRRAGAKKHVTARGIDSVIGFLRRSGAIPFAARPQEEKSGRDALLDGYAFYLVQERGLAATTVASYRTFTRDFLLAQNIADATCLAGLRASDVSSYVLREARKKNPGFLRRIIGGIRGFLRYSFVEGRLPVDLSGALPSVAFRRLAGIPKYLTPTERAALLRTPDRRTRLGCRTYAVLLLMLRLGLRSCEVAAICLGDINWCRGELTVRGKGRRLDTLPLPKDVGEAIVAYLKKGRPKHRSRSLFMTAKAPIRPVTSIAVGWIVRLAGDRCGLPHLGAHRLRHTAATQMLRNGASLTEIGQALRQHGVDTPAIYAKVDDRSLARASRPWPGVSV